MIDRHDENDDGVLQESELPRSMRDSFSQLDRNGNDELSASELREHAGQMRRSIVPVAFWYFSILGGITLLAYAIWREDPVFIVGQAGGLVIYGRNIYFIWRGRKEDADKAPETA